MLRIKFLLIPVVVALLTGTCFADLPEIRVPEGPIASALALVEEKRAYAAIEELEEFTPEFFDLGPYHYVLGQAFSLTKDTLKSAFHLRLASVYATQDELRETALLLAAETEYDAGYRFEAKSSCMIFLKKFPESELAGKVRILLARSLAGIGRHRDALRQFEMAGGTEEALFGKANTLQMMGMTTEATQAYSEAMSKNAKFASHDDDTRLWMGENNRISGLTYRAKNMLSKVTTPGNLDYAAFGLAEIAVKESRVESAIARFDKVASSKNMRLGRKAALRAAELEASNKNFPETARRLEELITKYPFTEEYDQATLLLARVRIEMGEYDEAVRWFLRLAARPSAVRAQALDEMERALLAVREKEPERLASLWSAFSQWLMNPSRESTLVMIADELRGSASYEELVQWLSKYGSTPVRARYLEMQAVRFAAAGETEEVRGILQKLKRENISGDPLIRTEGYLKFAEKDYVGAEQALLSLERMMENDILMLGELLSVLDDPQKTITALEEEISKTGVPMGVIVKLADVHYDAGRKEQAIVYYHMAAEKDPVDEWSCYRLFVLLGKEEGEEYRKRIVKDKALLRMADVMLKEQKSNER
ncbi:MAG: hypothetical protein FWH25_01400 [Syntrophorhabdaceae bacterium]|nr:hypothetical protein [Syntrophorhabdaceae bacterium]